MRAGSLDAATATLQASLLDKQHQRSPVVEGEPDIAVLTQREEEFELRTQLRVVPQLPLPPRNARHLDPLMLTR